MGQIHAVTMPKWGLEMTEGTLAAWHVPQGAVLSRGGPLADIETAKIVNTLEAEQDGTLRRLVATLGETLPVGALIAVLADYAVADSEIESFIADFRPLTAQEDKPTPQVASPAVLMAQNPEVNATPLARRLAQDLGVDLAQVKGTGRNGRISQEDVEAAAQNAGAPFELTPHSAMRRAISETLAHAKQSIPHYYLTMDIDAHALLSLRTELNARKNAPAKVSLNDFILRAAAMALVQVPEVNVHHTEQGVKRFHSVGLGFAVAVEGGLLVPVIQDAARLNIWEISGVVCSLVERARCRSLKPEEIAGGTFSVSNLGMFGVRHFEAIINPPQGGILAIGEVRREAREISGGVGFTSVFSGTLSCDHRVIDGALGATFLSAFKALIEDPHSLIV